MYEHSFGWTLFQCQHNFMFSLTLVLHKCIFCSTTEWKQALFKNRLVRYFYADQWRYTGWLHICVMRNYQINCKLLRSFICYVYFSVVLCILIIADIDLAAYMLYHCSVCEDCLNFSSIIAMFVRSSYLLYHSSVCEDCMNICCFLALYVRTVWISVIS